MLKKVKNLFNNVLEYKDLKHTIKYLRKELEESKQKEKPYIDKITLLENRIRIYRIINEQMENELKMKS